MRSISPRFWLLAIVSSILQTLPFAIAGPALMWGRVFAWIALTPLITAFLLPKDDGKLLTAREAAALGYVSGILWYLANCYWIYQTMYLYGGLPKLVAFGILILFSLYLGLYHALFGWLTQIVHLRLGLKPALLAAPFLWVAVELARARVTGFPWDLLGYAQVDNTALTTLAPLGGVMLLSFVIAAVCTLFAAAVLLPHRRIALALTAVAAAVLLQAGVAYHPAADAAPYVATLLQQNLVPGVAGRQVETMSRDERYRQFSDLSRSPGSSSPAPVRKPEFVVWPESPADFFSYDETFRAQVGGLARSMRTPVIAGGVGVDFDPAVESGHHIFGSAIVFDSNGRYAGRYDKIHRVPWGEYVPYKQLFFFAGRLTAESGDMEAGTQHTIFNLNGHKAGIFICYESIFGDEVRAFTQQGADILINISDDGWYGDTGAPWQHLDMERMRAIENHRWILRDTNTGITTSIDPHGRGDFTTQRHVRAAFSLPFDYISGTTFYARHGDWFAWLCVLVSAIFLAQGFRGKAEVH